MFSVGWLVAYLTVLLVIAEPLRNAGKYTMADVLAYRLKPRPVRAMASLSTLTVSTFYMIAQMVGAGVLVALLLKDSGIKYSHAVIGVGILMIVYVVFGGMLATTWVQIIKAILLMAGLFCPIFISVLRPFSTPLAMLLTTTKAPRSSKTSCSPASVLSRLMARSILFRAAWPSFSAPPDCRIFSSVSIPSPMPAPLATASFGPWPFDRHFLYHDHLPGLRCRYDCRPRLDLGSRRKGEARSCSWLRL
jgi:Na+(H+)/acetate symporter ActP